MIPCRAALAVPGDLATPTGGYRYDRRLLAGLRSLGHDVAHLALGASFPEPTPEDGAEAAAQLAALPADRPVLVDGLAFGALERSALTATRAPLVALVHHPLAHETGLHPLRRAGLARSEQANLALAAHVVVTSPHTARLLTRDYGVAPERITVARPGTDRPGGARAKADPPLLLSVGIQVPRKGHDVLLEALDRVADRPWQAVIVGAPLDPDHARLLARLAARPRLAGRVRLAGALPEPALAALYGRAHLFVLATRYEGHGMVLDEAMAHGLPVLSCATGAVPDTLAPGAGRLVPPDDPAAFAEALAALLDEPSALAALADASAAAGAALPAWTDTARQVSAVLERIMAAARRTTDER